MAMGTARATPYMVFQPKVKKDYGRMATLSNINAGIAISEIVKTTLGPHAMFKMLLDSMGGLVITNDGYAILREVDVSHPAAKSLIELSRSQDDETGDGTTSVVIVAGELLRNAEQLLNKGYHPRAIEKGYLRALEDSLKIIDEIKVPVHGDEQKKVVYSCISTKTTVKYESLIPEIAWNAVNRIAKDAPGNQKHIDIKKYIQIVKIPGGSIDETEILSGIMVNKDVTHPQMRRYIQNPKILILDCPLEYKKAESQTNVEIYRDGDWKKLLQQEEMEIAAMCRSIISTGCNVVVTEKGVSDLAQHFLVRVGISVIRRIRKGDSARLSRVSGAKIRNFLDEISSADVGTQCGLFEAKLIGDEYYTFFTQCKDPAACTILLRGASKDALNEIERNLHDAIAIARNVLMEPYILPGGGSTEIEIATRLNENASNISESWHDPYLALSKSLEIIPKILAKNAGAKPINALAELKHLHSISRENKSYGINGHTGAVADVIPLNIWDAKRVKTQILMIAVEAVLTLIRIDGIVSGVSKNKEKNLPAAPKDLPPMTN